MNYTLRATRYEHLIPVFTQYASIEVLSFDKGVHLIPVWDSDVSHMYRGHGMMHTRLPHVVLHAPTDKW